MKLFISWPFPAEPGIALAAKPEPHDKSVRLSPDGRRPLVLALVPRLTRATPGQRFAHAWHGDCTPEASSQVRRHPCGASLVVKANLSTHKRSITFL